MYNHRIALVVKWISQRSSEPSLGVRVPPGAQNMNKKKLVCKNVFCRHSNINIILSIIAIVWVWRGIWGLTDIVVFKDTLANFENIFGYAFPVLLGMFYLYFNDYSIDELAHGSPNQ